jgi:lysophospholipase L1-like esterase
MSGDAGRVSLAYVVFLAVVGFAVLEVGTRLLVKQPIPLVIPSADPQLVYELNPARKGINSLGMRGRELEPGELEGAFVVAAIGDSHTFSVKVRRNDRTIPAHIEQRLAARWPASNPRALNFGVPGYNAAQHLAVLEARVLDFEPDVIVLQYTINDLHVCNYLWPRFPGLNALIHKSHFAVFAVKRLLYSPFGQRHFFEPVGRRVPDLLLYEPGLVGTLRGGRDGEEHLRGHPPRDPERVPERYHYMLGRENWEHHLRRFGEVAREAGAALIGTGFIEAADRVIWESAGFEVVSFYDIFAGRDMLAEGGYDASRSSDHFSARGSRIIGAALADAIAERFEATPAAP